MEIVNIDDFKTHYRNFYQRRPVMLGLARLIDPVSSSMFTREMCIDDFIGRVFIVENSPFYEGDGGTEAVRACGIKWKTTIGAFGRGWEWVEKFPVIHGSD